MKKTIEYVFSEGARFGGDPQMVGLELARILRSQPTENSNVAVVVDAAADPESPLHRYFEWDDAKAAHEYRCEQARSLLRSIEIVYRDGDTNTRTRGFLSFRNEDGYRPASTVFRDADMRQLLVAEALKDAQAWQKRYAMLTELEPVFDAIGSAAKKLEAGGVKKQKAAA